MNDVAPANARPQPAAPDPVSEGDAAASEGNWLLAIDSWEAGLHGPRHNQATSRLQWFLQRGGTAIPQPSFRKPILLASTALALLGTALVFLAQSSSGMLATALAIAAWACYVATAIGAIMYAWRTGTTSSGPVVDAVALQHARNRARSLASMHEPNAPDVRR
jgi:phage-related minor tail protein